MPSRPLHKLLAALSRPRRKAQVMVVVQTERGQVAVPAGVLRDRLRGR